MLLAGLLPCPAQQAAWQQAEMLEQQGKFPEAEAIWSQLSSADPGDPGPLAHLGVLEARQNHYQAAVKYYRKALLLNAKLPGLQVDLGLAYFKMGDNRHALQILEPLAAADPGDQRITIIVGMAYYSLGQYKDAVPYLSRATDHDANNLELLLDLGHSCLLIRQLQCVRDAYNRIYAVSPDSVEAHMLKGETLDEAKDTLGAIQEFQAAVASNPAQPNVHFGLGYLLWTQKRHSEAASQFKEELANDPEHLQSKLYLADAEIQINDFEDGRRILENVTKTNPNIEMAHLDLGIIDSETNRLSEAVIELRRAIDLDSKDASPHWRLARLYRSMGMKSEANKEFEITRGLNQSEIRTLSKAMSQGPSQMKGDTTEEPTKPAK